MARVETKFSSRRSDHFRAAVGSVTMEITSLNIKLLFQQR